MAVIAKKLGVGCLGLLGILLVLGLVMFIVANEKKPTGTAGPEADALAEKMLVALDKPAWDSLKYVRFTFSGRNHYSWDKARNRAIIESGDSKVVMQLDSQDGVALNAAGATLSGQAKTDAMKAAWSNWCNDSFWLYAPYKVFDPNTTRSIVDGEDGQKSLLIDYGGGGVTPGDSYLWILDENNLPKQWKMWVNIIPLGGISTTWEDWTTTATGSKIAQKHMLSILDISISNLKTGQELGAIGYSEDPFKI